jgi:hypothetical protein
MTRPILLLAVATACSQLELAETTQALDAAPSPTVDAASGADAFCAAVQAPAAPEKPGFASQYDITNNGQPELMISGATAGATVNLYYTTASYQSCTANSVGQCSMRAIYNAGQVWSNFPEGDTEFKATQTVCGLESDKSPGRTLRFDYTITAPTIAHEDGVVSGTQNDGDTKIQVWGRKGWYWEIIQGQPPRWVVSGDWGYMGGDYTPAQGAWTTTTSLLNPFDGFSHYEMIARAQDTAGNVSWSTTTEIAPVPPQPWPGVPAPPLEWPGLPGP